MIPELASAFVGPFVYFSKTIALPDDPRPRVGALEFFAGPLLPRSLELARQRFPSGHRDAVTALWGRSYAAKVVPATVGAALILGRQLPVDLKDVQLVLADDGVSPCAFVVAHPGEQTASPDAFARFESMILGHFQPVIEALAEHGRGSRKVLWGNLALYIDYFLHASAAMENKPEGSFAFDPMPLLTQRLWRDGTLNPVFEPRSVVITDDGPQLRRKTCCLTHRLGTGNRCCLDCPIEAKRQRRAACVKEAA